MNIEQIQKFISKDHLHIEGWFFGMDQLAFYELFALQNRLKISGDVCEVGVYRGKSLVFLSLLKSSSERLTGFDLFEDDHQDSTLLSLEQYGENSGISLIKGLTSEIELQDLDAALSSPLRFLHIDAGHEYHEVLEQLRLFCPYVSDLGIVAMDDYQDREFPGIEAAVLDFAEQNRPRRFVPFLAGGNKMYLCATSIASILQKNLLAREKFKDSCRLARVRDFNVLIMGSKLPVASQQIISQLNELSFPQRPDEDLSLNQKSARYSQLRFGAGAD